MGYKTKYYNFFRVCCVEITMKKYMFIRVYIIALDNSVNAASFTSTTPVVLIQQKVGSTDIVTRIGSIIEQIKAAIYLFTTSRPPPDVSWGVRRSSRRLAITSHLS